MIREAELQGRRLPLDEPSPDYPIDEDKECIHAYALCKQTRVARYTEGGWVAMST